MALSYWSKTLILMFLKHFILLYPPPSPLPGESENPGVLCQKHLIPYWGMALWQDPPRLSWPLYLYHADSGVRRTWVGDLTQTTQLLRNYFITWKPNRNNNSMLMDLSRGWGKGTPAQQSLHHPDPEMLSERLPLHFCQALSSGLGVLLDHLLHSVPSLWL